MTLRQKTLTLLAAVFLFSAVHVVGQTSPTDESLPVIRDVAPLRSYETFPFTEDEYRLALKGEPVFKGREVPGSDLLEGAVAYVAKAPAWRLWRSIVDEEHHNQFMPQIKFSTVLKGRASGRLIFDFLELPVVSDRQWVVEGKHWGDLWKRSGGRIWLASFKTPANQVDAIRQGLASGKIPSSVKELQGDTVIIRESRASYTLIELPQGRTMLEYRAFSDPAGKIPSSILNFGAPRTGRALVKALEKQALQGEAHFKAAGHPTLFDPLDRVMTGVTPVHP